MAAGRRPRRHPNFGGEQRYGSADRVSGLLALSTQSDQEP
jgi:hypothetical protein